jgi:membrane-bound lytic murein transglycosylase A
MVQTTIMTKINKATPASKANNNMGNSSNKSLNLGFLSGSMMGATQYDEHHKPKQLFRPALALGLLMTGILLTSCTSVPLRQPQATQKSSPKTNEHAITNAELHPVSWGQLPGWREDDLTAAWPAWQRSCQGLNKRNPSGLNWKSVCAASMKVDGADNNSIRRYFENHMKVMEIRHQSGPSAGGVHGLVTGYYEPYLNGSRARGGVYQTAIHQYPSSWKKKKPSILPTRAELMSSGQLSGQEILWVDDAVAAAFMQVQGSGRVRMSDGKVVRLGFAGTNDQPFKSFAQWLLDRKEINRSTATMQGIQAWAKKNPQRVQEMLNANPRYVFFRELPATTDANVGPIGSLGVPLTAERSIAVDTKILPLGAPVFLATTYPLSDKPIQRLMMAQDTGSAIIGAVRADFYWGTGDQAGEQAGRMKQQGRMWILLPQ